MKSWTAKDLAGALYKNTQLAVLDVRDPSAYQSNHLDVKEGWTIHNLPFRQLLSKGKDLVPAIQSLGLPKEKEILAVCARGNASKAAAEILNRLGYQAATLEGGMQGWKDHYETREALRTPALSIYQIQRVGRGCLSYLIQIEGAVFAIDPPRHLNPLIELAQQMAAVPTGVFDTHAHADHISGGKALATYWKTPYFLHPYDAIHPMDLLPASFSYSPLQACLNLPFEVLDIPGHTLGNCAFLLQNKYLFTGDSIFIKSISRPDLGGKSEAWTQLHYHSLRKMLTLPDEVLILPAHFSSFDEVSDTGLFAKPLGELKNANEGLRMAQKPYEDFKSYIFAHLPEFPPEYIDIKRANLGLVEFTEEQKAVLESGKNVCAMKNP